MAGAYVVKHTDGNIMPIIDMIVDTGIDALNPLEPHAGIDIGLINSHESGYARMGQIWPRAV